MKQNKRILSRDEVFIKNKILKHKKVVLNDFPIEFAYDCGCCDGVALVLSPLDCRKLIDFGCENKRGRLTFEWSK